MSEQKSKKQRRLGRRCPDCGGELNIVVVDTFIDGVKYTEQIVECDWCDYYEPYHTSNKRNKNNFNPKW